METIQTALSAAGVDIVERIDFPARPARMSALPADLHPTVAGHLAGQRPDGIYDHQARALEAFIAGESVVLSTPTASGKSLVFMTAAADVCLRDPRAKVLALYPAKALIDDQFDHWSADMKRLGLTVELVYGGVPTKQRVGLMARAQIVLMTPDVVHAWLLRDKDTSTFLQNLRLLVLDEAHAYTGAFGTNMAFLLRRLRAASGIRQIIATTATLGDPERFVQALTGVSATGVGPAADGSPSPGRSILRVRAAKGDDFTCKVKLLQQLRDGTRARFLAFMDSRKSVAQAVVALERLDLGRDDDGEEPAPPGHRGVLPYRAGFEEFDRNRIQHALRHGELSGVVSTSALELGLDIGDMDIVALMTSPPTMKAFWQRAGRAGRRDRPGVCLWFDDGRSFLRDDLQAVLARQIEPSHLYLDNRYIQYGHALCAAFELGLRGTQFKRDALASLPPQFATMLDNELNPTEALPNDLMPIKMRAQNDQGPHWELPLRSGGEATYQIVERNNEDNKLGTAALSQVLREAYPGAIYYYVTTAYRVALVDARNRKVVCRREKRLHTTPICQSTVFPQFGAGLTELCLSDQGFIAEGPMQVSERVLGFSEKHGAARGDQHKYGPTSPFARQPLGRTFETTGVCWYFDGLPVRESACERIKRAFCSLNEIQESDVGFGTFSAKVGPGGRTDVKGCCVYDATVGSLRLTRPMVVDFERVLAEAKLWALAEGVEADVHEIVAMLQAVPGLRPIGEAVDDAESAENSVAMKVIAPNQSAVLMDQGLSRDVVVIGYRFTPKGLMYQLQQDKPAAWLVPEARVLPVEGQTEFVLLDPTTGEELT